jgi:hypothetical protein
MQPRELSKVRSVDNAVQAPIEAVDHVIAGFRRRATSAGCWSTLDIMCIISALICRSEGVGTRPAFGSIPALKSAGGELAADEVHQFRGLVRLVC